MSIAVEFAPREQKWRGRGHPRKEIPANVREIADRTYNTGHVGVVRFGEGEQADAAELVRLLRAYAKQTGRIVRVQRDPGEVRFELADRESAGE